MLILSFNQEWLKLGSATTLIIKNKKTNSQLITLNYIYCIKVPY